MWRLLYLYLHFKMCHVLRQPLNPNWGTASPQYNSPVTSSPQKRTDDLSPGCYNKSSPDVVISGTVSSSDLTGINWEITQQETYAGIFHGGVRYVTLSSKEAYNVSHTHIHTHKEISPWNNNEVYSVYIILKNCFFSFSLHWLMLLYVPKHKL